MKSLPLTLLVLSVWAGCQRKPDAASGENAAHGHEEEAGPASGASYKKGLGVLVAEETRKLLRLETVEVASQPLARKIEFVAQAFPTGRAGETTRWRASGLVPTEQLAGVQAGQEALLRAEDDTLFPGRVRSLETTLGQIHGETEVLLEFTGPDKSPGPVCFLRVTLTLPAASGLAVVPQSALLRTAEGTFVYVVNGDAFQRTAVKTGVHADGHVEITDGLLEGDFVVTRPVEALYLVELRAVKGGGHSH